MRCSAPRGKFLGYTKTRVEDTVVAHSQVRLDRRHSLSFAFCPRPKINFDGRKPEGEGWGVTRRVLSRE